MNCTLFVNEQGELCVAHDAPLPFEPRLIKHERGSNRLLAVGAEGGHEVIGDGIAPELVSAVHKAREILLVRLEDEEPVEGYDLPLIHV